MEIMICSEKASNKQPGEKNISYGNVYYLLLFLLFKNPVYSKTIPGKLAAVEGHLGLHS